MLLSSTSDIFDCFGVLRSHVHQRRFLIYSTYSSVYAGNARVDGLILVTCLDLELNLTCNDITSHQKNLSIFSIPCTFILLLILPLDVESL